jgi:hypothetical protein
MPAAVRRRPVHLEENSPQFQKRSQIDDINKTTAADLRNAGFSTEETETLRYLQSSRIFGSKALANRWFKDELTVDDITQISKGITKKGDFNDPAFKALNNINNDYFIETRATGTAATDKVKIASAVTVSRAIPSTAPDSTVSKLLPAVKPQEVAAASKSAKNFCADKTNTCLGIAGLMYLMIVTGEKDPFKALANETGTVATIAAGVGNAAGAGIGGFFSSVSSTLGLNWWIISLLMMIPCCFIMLLLFIPKK